MYKKFITTNIPALVPLIVEVCLLLYFLVPDHRFQAIKVRAQVQMARELDVTGETIPEVGMSILCANKTAYADLIGAQVKVQSHFHYRSGQFILCRSFRFLLTLFVVLLTSCCPINRKYLNQSFIY